MGIVEWTLMHGVVQRWVSMVTFGRDSPRDRRTPVRASPEAGSAVHPILVMARLIPSAVRNNV